MKRLLILLLLLSSCATPGGSSGGHPTNVILFIGDGMGFSQVTLARLVHHGPNGRLVMDDLPVTGFAKTHAADHWVTDSAAAATALSSGVKTDLHVIGQDPYGQPLETILTDARKAGLSTGLITTARITDATPAPFMAHVKERSMEKEIAEQLLGVDVLLGGGGASKYFDDALLDRYRAAGYAIVRTKQELDKCEGKALGLFAESHVPYVLDRAGEPSLAEMTGQALRLLSKNPRGYFLMVEGGRIDMACHVSDAPSSVHETIDMDAAVKVALHSAKKDGRTLIVITADHATGGLAITEKCEYRQAQFKKVRASVEKIETLKGDLRDRLREWAGVEDATPEELKAVEEAKPGFDRSTRIGEIVSRRCGVTFIPLEFRNPEPNRTFGHDGAMVPIYAFGPGASEFAGTLDNTDIPKRIRALARYGQ